MSNKLFPDKRTKTPTGDDLLIIADAADMNQMKSVKLRDLMKVFNVTTTSTSTTSTSTSTSTTTT